MLVTFKSNLYLIHFVQILILSYSLFFFMYYIDLRRRTLLCRQTPYSSSLSSSVFSDKVVVPSYRFFVNSSSNSRTRRRDHVLRGDPLVLEQVHLRPTRLLRTHWVHRPNGAQTTTRNEHHVSVCTHE